MAEPSFYGEGTTPRISDTRHRILTKIVGAVYNKAAAPNVANKPLATDTRRQLLRKWNRLKTGT